jgi:hypothetical protein
LPDGGKELGLVLTSIHNGSSSHLSSTFKLLRALRYGARWREGVGLGTNKDIQWIIIAIVINFQAFASFEKFLPGNNHGFSRVSGVPYKDIEIFAYDIS